MISLGLDLTEYGCCCQCLWRKQSWGRLVAAVCAAEFGSAWTAPTVSDQPQCPSEIIIWVVAAAGTICVNSLLPWMSLKQFNQCDSKEKVKWYCSSSLGWRNVLKLPAYQGSLHALACSLVRMLEQLKLSDAREMSHLFVRVSVFLTPQWHWLAGQYQCALGCLGPLVLWVAVSSQCSAQHCVHTAKQRAFTT